MLQTYFYQLADALNDHLQAGEIYTIYLEAEDSDFARFNHNRIRQAGHVQQVELTLDLINDQRHAAGHCTLSGVLDGDLPRLQELLAELRQQYLLLPDDIYLYYATTVCNTEVRRENTLPPAGTAVAEIIHAAEGLDLVGLWASGAIYRGFANSLGQRNWYATANFNFDWSCYLHTDKAVKASLAGFVWDNEQMRRKMATVKEQLDILARSAKTIAPGQYRVYLAPSALYEIFGLLSWYSFGLKSHRTKQTALLKMVLENKRLHPDVNLSEENANGIAPGFTNDGFIKPEHIPLINSGCYRDCLVNPRSSKEYGVPVNAGTESPQSLALAAGQIPEANILERLDTGIYINHLWYCNFSDRNDARITGMTRFACFWVEQGQFVAPINVMRFDESIYRMLGDKLLGLTQERQFIFDADTYERRSVGSVHLPGALIEDFRFTL